MKKLFTEMRNFTENLIEYFKRILKKSKFPLQIGEVRMASEPLYSVAKGALVMALAEEKRR